MTAKDLRSQLEEAETGVKLPVDEFAAWVFAVVPKECRARMRYDETTKFAAGAVNVEFKDDEELMGLYARWILEKSDDPD